MISFLYLLVGISLLFFSKPVPVTGSRELRKPKTLWLSGITLLTAAFNFFILGLLPDNTQVFVMAGLPVLVVIIALLLSEKKQSSFSEPVVERSGAGQMVVNIITWGILLVILGVGIYVGLEILKEKEPIKQEKQEEVSEILNLDELTLDEGQEEYLRCVYLADLALEEREAEIAEGYDNNEYRGGTASGLYQAAESLHAEQIEICNKNTKEE